MNEPVETLGTGIFWVPGFPSDRRGTGTLRWVTQSGRTSLVLETLGLRSEATPEKAVVDSFGFREELPLLHGLLQGKPITLINAVQTSFQVSFPGPATIEYSPDFAILGTHLSLSPSDYPVEISFQMDDLRDFMGSGGATQIIQGIPDLQLGSTINYSYPPEHACDLPDFRVELKGDASTKRHGSTVSLTDYAYFKVTNKAGFPIPQWYSDVLLPLLQLVRFASTSQLSIGTITLRFAEGSGDHDQFPSDRNASEILINRSEVLSSKPIPKSKQKWLFKAGNLNAKLLDNFLSSADVEGSLHARLYEIENLNLNWDETLFQLVRLLESRHRHLYPAGEDRVRAHVERVVRITNQLSKTSKSDAKLVEQGLKYAYEPRLQKRLLELTRHWQSDIQGFYPSGRKLGSDLGKISEHRNFLAHGLPAETPPLSGNELRSACILLMIVIRLHILSEVGFEHKKAWKLIEGTEYFHAWLRLLAETDGQN